MRKRIAIEWKLKATVRVSGSDAMPEMWLWENRIAIVFAKSRLLHIISFLLYSIMARRHRHIRIIGGAHIARPIANTNTGNCAHCAHKKEAASNHFHFKFRIQSSVRLPSPCIYRHRHFDFNNIIHDRRSAVSVARLTFVRSMCALPVLSFSVSCKNDLHMINDSQFIRSFCVWERTRLKVRALVSRETRSSIEWTSNRTMDSTTTKKWRSHSNSDTRSTRPSIEYGHCMWNKRNNNNRVKRDRRQWRQRRRWRRRRRLKV